MAGKAQRQPKTKSEFTYGDYLTWPDTERWELIDGDAYAMTPGPDADHQRILVNFCVTIGIFLKGKKCEILPAPFDVLLPIGDEADEDVKTVVQPDVIVVCDPDKITRRGCRGAPDWVIEILSPSTASRDQILKRRRYEKAGVKEYWICNPTDRVIFVYHLHKNKLVLFEIYDDKAKIEVATLPGLTLDCSEVFPPAPPVIVRESPAVYL
ncbi:MAG: Uma2 family endonuclease [Candidatus Riflebacteria bacterium HGW-Riflebacteria-1]|nr:MAG: Uma2 family endonuclease [Candidatus Riflebacteria bacterium HGW-Riflebacteria-1]